MRKGQSRKRGIKGWGPGLLFLAPSLLGVGVFVCIPFGDVVRRSFLNAMGNEFVGLDNYRSVLQNRAFGQAAGNTARFLALCVPLLLAISLLCAMGIKGSRGFREGLKTAALLPMAIPAASLVVLWRLAFGRAGFLNGVLGFFGLPAVDWMNSEAAFGVLVFTYLWKNVGYDMILWLAGLAAIPDEQYEAARIDGAGRVYSFWYITLPHLRTSAAAIAILSVVNCFRVFREAYLIAGDYPQESIYLLQHLFNNWFASLDIQKMAAGAVLLALLMMGIMALAWHKNEEGAWEENS